MKKKMLSAALATTCAAMAFSGSAKAQSVPISTIYSGGPSTYTITGTVTEILNASSTKNSIILQDSTGSVLAYNVSTTAYTPTLGDSLTFTDSDTTYQGSPELGSSPTSVSFTPGTVPTPPVLTIPQFIAAGTGSTAQTAVTPYAEALVTLDNVYLPPGTTTIPAATNTTFALTDGLGNMTNMYTYKSDSAVNVATAAADAQQTASGGTFLSGPLDITGYVDVYYGVPEIYPTSITAGTAVPEPASLGVIGLGAICMLRRRRQTV